ncbi:MAG TPA: hypothetical protein VEX86_18115 [Longimicrobium sp.]|nr:hypothetical protein [Longimicrobium sp.]
MSSAENSTQGRPQPSNPHRVERKRCGEHDYEVGFYPGFASRIVVNGTEVYKQPENESFVLPDGAKKPLTSHAVEIKCSKGYNVVLHMEDPHHVVDQIVIKLKEPVKDGGGVFANQAGGGNGDTVTIDNTAATCPPICR